MTSIDDLLANNRRYAETVEKGGGLGAAPTLPVAIVTCMDCRIDVYRAFGLELGQAHVLRNGGGVVTEDVLRSLVISQRELGTREVMLVHHSTCGMTTMTEDGFRAKLLAETGMTPAFAIECFQDIEADVRQSILRVRGCAFLPHRDAVRGFVYDVETRLLNEVSAG